MILKDSAANEGAAHKHPVPHRGVWLRVLNRASGGYLHFHTEQHGVLCICNCSVMPKCHRFATRGLRYTRLG